MNRPVNELYNDGSTVITPELARFGGTVMSTASIHTVFVQRRRGFRITLFIFGLVFAALTLLPLAVAGERGLGPVVILPLLMGIMAVYMLVYALIAKKLLVVYTPAGSTIVRQSRSVRTLEKIRDAIEQAMAMNIAAERHR